MYCPGCGNQIADTATFCPKCGRQLKQRSKPGPSLNILSHLPSPAVLRKAAIALVAVLIVAGVGFGAVRFLSSRPPQPFKMLDSSPEKIAKKLDKMVEIKLDSEVAYFSSKEFADYFKTASNEGLLDSNVSISKQYTGDYVVLFLKGGSSFETLSKSQMRLGLKPSSIVYMEVTKDKVTNSEKFVKKLKWHGISYDRVFAITVNDLSELTSLISAGAGTLAFYYKGDKVGAAGLGSTGDTRIWIENVAYQQNDSVGVMGMFEKVDDPETRSEVLERLGSEGGDYYLD